MKDKHTSRIPGFYKRSLAERAAFVAQWADLSPAEQSVLVGVNGLSPAQADNMIENAVGTYALPLAVATNFLVNGRDYLIPMVVEEPSVVAAVSNAAKLFRESGGFHARGDEPVMIGQIQVLDLPDLYAAAGAVRQQREMLLQEANRVGGSIVQIGRAHV
jgi:hydroxymethylglutaryl-CoA reductase